MIYHLYFGLVMSGYAACSTLLGGYMMQYAGAREIDLGFIFMVQPMTIFFRPFICAHADRRQIHRQMLAFYATLTALAYVPFIIYPSLYQLLHSDSRQTLTNGTASRPGEEFEAHDLGETLVDVNKLEQNDRLIYWLLMFFHLIGSIGFCGVRSLGDALAVNYAKRIGSDFARYRKYGSLSYGICNFLLGFINQDWLMPNFVPALCVYTGSMLVLAPLVFSWPHIYFEMSCQDKEDERAQRDYIDRLPSVCACFRHVASKMCRCVEAPSLDPINRSKIFDEDDKDGGASSSIEWHTNKLGSTSKLANKLRCGPAMQTSGSGDQSKTLAKEKQAGKCAGLVASGNGGGGHQLTVGQQVRIFGLLLERDFRILLYLLIILYGGLTGYSGPNFVFTYINLVCNQRGTCKGAQLSGLVMLGYCFVETTVYLIVDKYGHKFNRTIALEATFLVLAFHYNFYGFALDHLSPYFFLVEALHGIEYGISLTASVELGYYFAREVELLLPELRAKGIVTEEDNIELVKVSLMATMSGCYTLAYDGIGCILGCLLFGLVLGNFGFNIMWISIGAAAGAGFIVIMALYTMGKCLGVRPEILRIRDRRLAEERAETESRQVVSV